MALSSYECAKALQLFQRLPQNQYNTAWVLCLVGRSHFELADYTKSTTAFAEAHRLSPNNLEVGRLTERIKRNGYEDLSQSIFFPRRNLQFRGGL